ncbi:MAG: REP-associated tyrosine transposase [Anaerolineae bacterium]
MIDNLQLKHLPHFDKPLHIQAITFHLRDSMPASVRAEWQERADISKPEFRAKIQAYLDTGQGSCILRVPLAAAALEQVILYNDTKSYSLLAWVIMPNHVHILVRCYEGTSLAVVIDGWKKFSALAINHALGRTGSLWQRDYFDRYIRNDSHLFSAVTYVHNNPVMAGLVKNANNWPFGSAIRVDTIDSTFHSPYGEEW